MKLSLIVAMTNNGVIGLNGQIPWHLSADLKRFKKITLGSPIIMGRKTFESIGKPLPGRTNIIISANPLYFQPDCLVFNNIQSAIDHCRQHINADEAFIIGGSALYEATLPHANTLYVTEIAANIDGDTYFPAWDKDGWQEITREEINNDPQVDFTYRFLVFSREEPL